ncbi:DUF4397 domain-containing protein [Dictyobacter arantiisoli]|uniref:Cell wall anchor n=1 Tax=Dictyobacter arantiisoli TaxID=2014874 RepID=A0A5A5T621_9CHLR|nr:DUF4397 domain-containing protein [Dictyobacter arantiisoli]GCF06818.1 cell wall anchor [Dictyobacter arantiisoli]
MDRPHHFNKYVYRYGLMVVIASLVSLYSFCALSSPKASADESTSYVRVIHASPFVGTADVFVDGKPFLNGFRFASVTDYAALPAGNHKVQIALVGKGIGAAALTKTLPVQAGEAYTIAAVGASPQTLNLQVFVDDNRVVANYSKVRIYHLIPDAGTITVSIGEDTTIKDMAYQDNSDYVTVDSGPCTFAFTMPSSNEKMTLPRTLAANTVTSVFAVGMLHGNPKAQLVAATTQGIPGLPQTGSDPNAMPAPTSIPASPIWLLAMALLGLLGLGITRHFRRSA